MKNIRKGDILYKGMKRGRRRFLIINIIVTVLYIMFMSRAMPFVIGKLHGPYEFNSQKFFSSTSDIVIDKVVEMLPREDKAIPSYTFLEYSYQDEVKYRFNVKFDSLEKVFDGISGDTQSVGFESSYRFNSIYLGKIGDKTVPVLWDGSSDPVAGAYVSGIFTQPAKIVVSRISQIVPERGPLNINEYVFDARGIEMETENTDIPFAIMGLALLAFLYIRLIRYYINPYNHPTYKRIEKYGDIDDVVNKIEDQFLNEEVKRDGTEYYTTDWIMTKEFFSNKIKINHRTSGKYS